MVFLRNTCTAPFLLFRRRGRIFALALAVLSIALFVAPAHAASVAPAAGTPPPGFSVSGSITEIASPNAYQDPNARFFDLSREPLQIPLPHYYVVSSSLVGGDYRYLYELNASPGSVAASIEVAINPVDHTQLIEAGVPTPDSVARATIPATASSAPQSMTRPASGGAGQASAVHPYTSSTPYTRSTSGYYQTTWYDPPGFVMNWVQDHMNFTYDGTYVDSASYWDAWFDQWDGWYQHYHSNGAYWGSNDTSLTAWTYALHQNDIFCAGQSTFVTYSDNNLVAHGSGGVGGYVSTSASGGCSSWLHHDSFVSGGA